MVIFPVIYTVLVLFLQQVMHGYHEYFSVDIDTKQQAFGIYALCLVFPNW